MKIKPINIILISGTVFMLLAGLALLLRFVTGKPVFITAALWLFGVAVLVSFTPLVGGIIYSVAEKIKRKRK